MSRRRPGDPGGRDINAWHQPERPPGDAGCMRLFLYLTIAALGLALLIGGVLS